MAPVTYPAIIDRAAQSCGLRPNWKPPDGPAV